MTMKFVVKKATAKATFYDNTTIECNSLEELLKTIYEENDPRTARSVEIEGITEKGDTCRAWFDFNNLIVKQNPNAGEFSKTLQKQSFLGQTLADSGIITQGQLEKALEHQRQTKFKEKIGEVLITLGFCNAEQILYGLAKQIGVFLQTDEKEEKK